ncbi:MAG TPA: HEAT repeat domain-containing protein [Longimicrobiales bacterium]|nr:HEAT repeat domain-containing protein [Longimicrobiales bacterium]
MSFAEVNDLVQQIVKSARAHQIYDASNPVYHRFISNLKEALAKVFTRVSEVRFELSDDSMVWEGQAVAAGEGKENLAFLFFRDGVRSVTFLPGFEDEVEAFLGMVHRGRHGSRDSEDLITLLWEADFQSFRYDYVDQLAQGLEIPESHGGTLEAVPYEMLSVDVQAPAENAEAAEAAVDESAPPSSMGAIPPVTAMDGIVRPSDFNETLYFLDEAEMRILQREVRKEMERDAKTDVLNALFDRIEDGSPERQEEILDILCQLLPSLLSRGDMVTASRLLVELRALLERSDLPPELRARADTLFDDLSRVESLNQLVRALEDGALQPGTQELGIFFMHLRPSALPTLLAATWKSHVPELRTRMEAGLDAVGRAHPAEVLRMLDAPEPEVAAAAAGLAARLGLEQSTPGLSRLMTRDEPEVRLAAVEAAISLHTGQSMSAAQAGLEDGDREVRMAAAKGLAKYRFQPSRARVEQVIRDRITKESDRTERVLFFEAYAQIGGADAVAYLDSVLNARGLMGSKYTAELRACAARALALIATPAAKEALSKASSDKEIVVRTEVSRALRQESPKP